MTYAHTTGQPSEELVSLDFGGPSCIDFHINEGEKIRWEMGQLKCYLFAIVLSSSNE